MAASRWRPFTWTLALAVAGCLTPQYAVRQTPHPVESPDVIAIEQRISAIQAQELTRDHRLVDPVYAAARGFDIPRTLSRLVAVSERSYLLYHVLVIDEGDPNAAALADGRLFITTGMLDYLAQRGSREDELAFILAHELAHTTAQHLVKRIQQMQWTQVVTGLAGAAAAGIAGAAGSASAQGAGQVGQTIANVAGNIYVAGYSQGQELEADQLGARYVIRAGYDPLAGIRVLEDFQRFDPRGLYLSTHPYSARRAADLTQFLLDVGWQPTSAPSTAAPPAPRFLAAAPSAPPPLRLERIVWNAAIPSKRRAIINGRSITMGDFIGGAQVILIEQRRVQLFKDGREFWLESR